MLSAPSLWYEAFGVLIFFNHVCTHQLHTEIILTVRKSVEMNNEAGSTHCPHALLSWGKVIRFTRVAVSLMRRRVTCPVRLQQRPRLAAPGGTPGLRPPAPLLYLPFLRGSS